MSSHAPRTFTPLLGALSGLGPLTVEVYLAGVPRLARDLDASALAVQTSLAACFLGLAAGQLLGGIASDRLGRRPPVLCGLGTFVAASALCAVAPTVELLILLRLLQGGGAGVAIVVSRAVVRDLWVGAAAAARYSRLMLVIGASMVAGPLAGGLLLRVMSWRGVFLVVAGAAALLLLATTLALAETLPPARRRAGNRLFMRPLATALPHDHALAGHALVAGLGLGALLAFLAGSPFAFQEVHGLSPQRYALVLGVIAFGYVLAAQANARLVMRIEPRRVLRATLALAATGGLALIVVIAVGAGTFALVAAASAAVVPLGCVTPNATALALAGHPDRAGAAAGVLGVGQFAVAASAAPLVSIAGEGAPLPMALTLTAFSLAALLVLHALPRAGTPGEAVVGRIA